MPQPCSVASYCSTPQDDGVLALLGKVHGTPEKRGWELLDRIVTDAAGELQHHAEALFCFARRAFLTSTDTATRASALNFIASMLSAGDEPLPDSLVSHVDVPSFAKVLRDRLVSQDARSPGGVRAGIFAALGAICSRYFTTGMLDEHLPAWLQGASLHILDDPKAENMVQAAALGALSCALDVTPLREVSDVDADRAMRHAIVKMNEVTTAQRYGAVLAGLTLLAQHVKVRLRPALLRHVAPVITALEVCVKKDNASVRDKAKRAITAAFDALSSLLCDENAASVQDRRVAYRAAHALVDTLVSEADAQGGGAADERSAKNQRRAYAMALRAIGALVPAATCLHGDQELAKVLALLQRLSGLTGTSADAAMMDKQSAYKMLGTSVTRVLAVLDAYVRVWTAIQGQRGVTGAAAHISSASIDAVERILVDNAARVVSRFPALSKVQREEVAISLAQLLAALAAAHGASSGHVARLLDVLTLRWLTASLDVYTPAAAAVMPDMNIGTEALALGEPLWQRYAPLWTALFAKPDEGGRLLWDALCTRTAHLLSETLDLRTQRVAATKGGAVDVAVGDDDDEADLGEGWVAVTPSDVATAAHLCSLLASLLPHAPPDGRTAWCVFLAQATVDAARTSPALPPLYTLLSALCASCGQTLAADEACGPLLRDYIAECATRAREADDVRDTLLRLVLSAPSELIAVAVAAPAAGAALRLGVSAPSLAAASLTALERMQDTAPDELARFLEMVIIPGMQPLIVEAARREARGESASEEAASAAAAVAAAQAPGAIGGRETATRAKRAARRGAEAARHSLVADEDVIACATRCQILLGRWAGAAHALVTAGGAAEDATALPARRGTSLVLGLRVGASSKSLTILSLDDLLPHVAHLAQHSPDRVTKVAACELVHAIAVLLVGKQAQAHSGAGGSLHLAASASADPLGLGPIYRLLYPALLALAVDAEKVAGQLFRPLTAQIAHWIGHTAPPSAPDRVAFLEALFDGAADRGNGALREHCCMLIGTLVQWTVKDVVGSATPAAVASNIDIAVEDVLVRCYAALAHPNPWTRCGGASALARAAQQLIRVSDVDGHVTVTPLTVAVRHAVRAVRHCCESLSQSDSDPPGCGANSFARVASRRFSRIAGSQAHNAAVRVELEDLCEEAWRMTTTRNVAARAEAQRLVLDLVPKLVSGGSVRQWLESRAEGGIMSHVGAPTAPPVTLHAAPQNSWYAHVEAALQWAGWVIDKKVLSSADVAQLQVADTNSISPCEAARVLFSRMADNATAIRSPLSASAVLRAIIVLIADLSTPQEAGGCAITPLVAVNDISRVLLVALFRPSVLGVGPDRPATARELTAAAAKLLATCAGDAAPEVARTLLTTFRQQFALLLTCGPGDTGVFAPTGLAITTLVEHYMQGSRAALASTMNGYEALNGASADLLPRLLPSSTDVAAKLVSAAVQLPNDAPVGQLELARRGLALALEHIKTADLLAALTEGLSGLTFFERFKDKLTEHLLRTDGGLALASLFDLIAAGNMQAGRVAEAVLDAARVSLNMLRDANPEAGSAAAPPYGALLRAASACMQHLSGLCASTDIAAKCMVLGIVARSLDLDELWRRHSKAEAALDREAMAGMVGALLRPLAISPAAGEGAPSIMRRWRMTADASVATDAISLLPHFGGLVPAQQAPIEDGIAQLLSHECIPLLGVASVSTGHPDRAAYLALRHSLLDALVSCARRGFSHTVQHLLSQMMNIIVWDQSHEDVTSACNSLALAAMSKSQPDDSVARAIASVAMRQLQETHTRLDFPAAAVFLLLRPLLRAAPQAFISDFFAQHVKELLRLADGRGPGVGQQAETPSGFDASAVSVTAPKQVGDIHTAKRRAVYALVQTVYECGAWPTAFEAAQEVWQAGRAQEKLTVAWTRRLTTEMKTLGNPLPGFYTTDAVKNRMPLSATEARDVRLAVGARECRAAAFAAFSALLAASQGADRLKDFVGRLLSGEWFANGSWAAVVDCLTPVTCKMEVGAAPERARSALAPATGVLKSTVSSSLRAQATISTSTSASLQLDDAQPAQQQGDGDLDTALQDDPETAVDVDTLPSAAVDILDDGPVLDALVRLLEQCARTYSGEINELAQQCFDAGVTIPTWLAPLLRALDGVQPLAPLNAQLLVAKAVLRLHGRAQEAEERRNFLKALKVRMRGATREELLAALADAGMHSNITLGASLNMPPPDATLSFDGAGASSNVARRDAPLIRRGRPHKSMPSQLAVLFGSRLIELFVREPSPGGRAVHDVLRQMCWFLLDCEVLWSKVAADSLRDTFGASLSRLLDYLVTVADAAGHKGSAQSVTGANIDLIKIIARRAAANWTAVVTSHPSRGPLAEALRGNDKQRNVGLRLLIALMTPYEQWSQPLAFDMHEADNMADRIIAECVPVIQQGTQTVGSKTAYTAAGLCLGLELARRRAAGAPGDPRWLATLMAKLRDLGMGGAGTAPFVFILACIAEHYPQIACSNDMRSCLTENVARTSGDVRWAALECLAIAATYAAPQERHSLWTALRHRLPALTSAAADDGALERVVRLLGHLLLAPWDSADGDRLAASRLVAQMLHAALFQHRSAGVRLEHATLLRDMATEWPVLLDEIVVRQTLLAGVVDAHAGVREVTSALWDTALPSSTFSNRFDAVLPDAYTRDLAPRWATIVIALLLKLPNRNVALCEEPLLGDAPLSMVAPLSELAVDTRYPGGTFAAATLGVGQGGILAMTQQATLSFGGMDGSTQGVGGASLSELVTSATQDVVPEWLRRMTSAPVAQVTAAAVAGGIMPPDAATGATQSAAAPLAQRASGAVVPPRRLISAMTSMSDAGDSTRRPGSAERRTERLKTAAMQAGHDVHLLRHYRTGSFPDVRVCRKDFLGPLAALALRDSDTARMALTALSKGMWAEVGVPGAHAAIRTSLARMLGDVSPEAALVAALHGIALSDEQSRDAPGSIPALLDTQAVAAVSQRAGQLASGTTLVEHAVLYGRGGAVPQSDANAGPAAKRMRVAADVPQTGDGLSSPSEAMRAARSALSDLLGASGDEVLALQVMTAPATASMKAGGADQGGYSAGIAQEEPSTRALKAMLDNDDAGAATALADAIAGAEEGMETQSLDGDDGHHDNEKVLAWRRDRLHILQRMGEWTIAAEEAHELVAEIPQLNGCLDAAWTSHAHRFALACLVRAAVRLSDERAAVMGALSADVVRDSDFKSAFALELAQLDILRTPPAPDASAALLAAAFRSARAHWAAAPAGAIGLRHGLVAGWQAPAELSEALKCVRALCGGGHADAALLTDALVAPWILDRWPSLLYAPASALESVLSNRMACLDALQSLGADSGRVSDLRRQLLCGAGDAARRRGAYALAQTYLGPLDKAQRDGSAPFDFGVKASLIKICIAQADAKGTDALSSDADAVENLLTKPLRALHKAVTEHGEGMQRNARWMQAAHTLRSALGHRLSYLAPPGEAAGMAADSFSAARDAVACAVDCGDQMRVAKSHIRLAQLLDDALASEWTGNACANAVIQAAGGAGPAAGLFTKSVLTATARGGSQVAHARGALPRVLSLLGMHADARVAFDTCVANVPLWMWLPWSNQMLACLGGEQATVLLPPLRALASVYPRAMHFPVRIAAESDSAASALVIDNLVPLVRSDATAAFGRAVEDLCFPHVRLKAWIQAIELLAEEAAENEAIRPRVVALLRRMAEDVASESAAKSRGAGLVNVTFSRSGEQFLKQRLGGAPDFPTITSSRGGWNALRQHLTHFDDDMEQAKRASLNAAKPVIGTKFRTVEMLSGHLARMHNIRIDNDAVELPGQYNTDAAPDPSRHRRVVGCDPLISFMESKQLPVRLKLRLDDGSEATMLAKGGEDLRLDARMQSLFRMCAGSIANHRRACARGLVVATFHVEPISTQAGLVAWLPRAEPLHTVLRTALQNGDRNADEQCYKLHSEWVHAQARMSEKSNASYTKLMEMPEQKLKAAEVAAHLERMHARIPATLLRDVLMSRARSAEAFFASRHTFETTLTAGNAACYICGVSDRHLGNIMLDDSGKVIHIDFGYSFGQGLSLAVPELVPFRLTRSLTGALAPYDSTGLFVHDLGLALEALHATTAPLCAAMEVFVHEPLDWTREAMRMGMGSDLGAAVAHKLRIARDKLQHVNPVTVLLDDLKVRQRRPSIDHWRVLEELVRGIHSAGTMRNATCSGDDAAMDDEAARRCLSPEEQAAVLIDMAQDPNLLGRAWVGWRSWL